MNTTDITIETDNLLLEPISMDYRDQIFEEFTPEITKYMYPAPPKKLEHTERFIQNSKKKNKEGSDFQVAVLDKGTEDLLGCAGLHNIDTETPKLGIWIKKSAYGNAYGKEAITALKEWGDEDLEYEYLIYPAAEENTPSRRTPEALRGKVKKEYDETNMSGMELHMLEYRIYPEV